MGPMTLHDLAGTPALLLSAEGAAIGSERDATDLIGEALGVDAQLVVIPAERLSADFFTLSTRKAGLFIQKFTNYRIRLAIVGEIGAHVDASQALADFVRESNRGRSVWFVRDMDELRAKLAA
jgi:hypothetical protein